MDSTSPNRNSPFNTTPLFETAKWLIGIFGVVAGALLASIPFAGLGNLRAGSDEFRYALTGVVLAVLGALVAIGGATFALTSGFVDFKKVERTNATRWFCTNQSLKYFLVSARPDIVTSAGYSDPTDWWNKLTSEDVEIGSLARTRLDALMPLLTYLSVRRRLRLGIAVIFVGVVMTAGGAALFAWNISRPKVPQLSAASGQPLEVVVRLSVAGQDELRNALGNGCAPAELGGLLLANTTDGNDVLLARRGSCPPFRLALTPLLGSVEQQPVGAG